MAALSKPIDIEEIDQGMKRSMAAVNVGTSVCVCACIYMYTSVYASGCVHLVVCIWLCASAVCIWLCASAVCLYCVPLVVCLCCVALFVCLWLCASGCVPLVVCLYCVHLLVCLWLCASAVCIWLCASGCVPLVCCSSLCRSLCTYTYYVVHICVRNAWCHCALAILPFFFGPLHGNPYIRTAPSVSATSLPMLA